MTACEGAESAREEGRWCFKNQVGKRFGQGGERKSNSNGCANDRRRSSTAVVSLIRWQVIATDVPNICGELITH